MISHLTGTILTTSPDAIILDVHGVGYHVHVAPTAFGTYTHGDEITMWTYLSVRETALEFFGFMHKDELDFFKLLIGVSGVGPKSALGIISLASVETLKSAIASGDTSYLTKVSGIGPKSAKKIIAELQDKLGTLGVDATAATGDVEVLEALVGLGYSAQESRDALQAVDTTITETNERIKAALKQLG